MISSDTVPDDARRQKTDRESDDATAVRAVTIGKPREEVFAFFRDFTQPRPVHGEHRAHRCARRAAAPTGWSRRRPAIRSNGTRVITEEEPGRLLAWETDAGRAR